MWLTSKSLSVLIAEGKRLGEILRGPKRIEIDWHEFNKLCELQCTKADMAFFFGCSEDTIERAVKREWKKTFSEYFEDKRRSGHVSLRRKMHEIAMSGNVVMLIWLSKNWLGYSDKIDNKVNADASMEVTLDLGDGDHAGQNQVTKPDETPDQDSQIEH